MGQLVVRYFASARAASGVSEEHVEAASLADALALLGDRHGERLSAIVRVSTLLLDGTRVTDRSMELPPRSELEVLPPFAGG